MVAWSTLYVTLPLRYGGKVWTHTLVGTLKIVASTGVFVELELELIQTHLTQKPVLRVEVGAVS
jgi:hypothetical protein